MSLDLTPWHSLPLGEVFARLSSGRDGLSSAEAKKRQVAFGVNKIISGKKISQGRVFSREFISPSIIALIVAGTLTIFLGETGNALVIFGAVLLGAFTGFFSDKHILRLFRGLRDKELFFASVRRDGAWRKLAIEEIVPGDIVALKAGNKVPADMRLVAAYNLIADESSFVGEQGVAKTVSLLKENTNFADRLNMLWRGTSIVYGRAEALVVATGEKTEFSRTVQEDKGLIQIPFVQKMRRLGVFIFTVAASAALVLGAIGLSVGRARTEIFLFGALTLIALAPQGLSLAIATTVSRAARRVFAQGGLVKRPEVFETLGLTSVILTDKTGIFTEGSARVTKILTAQRSRGLFELESNGDPNLASLTLEIAAIVADTNGRPIDRAVVGAALRSGILLKEENKKLEESGIRIALQQTPEGKKAAFFAGAPETIFDYAHRVELSSGTHILRPDEKTDLLNAVARASARSFEVLAVGYRLIGPEENFRREEILGGGTFVGLVFLKDSIYKNARDMTAIARGAGLKIAIVTGEHPLAARSLAQKAGARAKRQTALSIMEGKEVDAMSVRELAHQVRSIDIFARVSGGAKAKIVEAWRSHSEKVAVAGDDASDILAVQKADVAFALGSSADTVRESAHFTILENGIAALMAAIREGRAVLDNLKKIVVYLLAGGLAEFVLIAISFLAGLPPPLLIAQILWIGLVELVPPVMALGWGYADDDDAMKRTVPKGLFVDHEARLAIAAVAFSSALFSLAIYLFFLSAVSSIEHARTMVFASLVSNFLFSAFSVRNLRRPIWRSRLPENKYLICSILVSFAFLAAAIYFWPLQTLLKTEALTVREWMILAGFGILNMAAIELAKGFIAKIRKSKKS